MTVVLFSGGLDSAVLLAIEAERAEVVPAYVSVGLAWEEAERSMVDHLLQTPAFRDRVRPLASLDFSMRDVYARTHWAVQGTPPDYDTPDEAVYLPGRNLGLLTKAAVLAAGCGASAVSLGILADNPFPDATPAFFDAMARAASLGLDHAVEIRTPLAGRTKAEVIREGAARGVPLEYTLSCMNPVPSQPPVHCGLCSKCRERRDAFAAAGLADPSVYAHATPRAIRP